MAYKHPGRAELNIKTFLVIFCKAKVLMPIRIEKKDFFGEGERRVWIDVHEQPSMTITKYLTEKCKGGRVYFDLCDLCGFRRDGP